MVWDIRGYTLRKREIFSRYGCAVTGICRLDDPESHGPSTAGGDDLVTLPTFGGCAAGG